MHVRARIISGGRPAMMRLILLSVNGFISFNSVRHGFLPHGLVVGEHFHNR